MRHWGRVSALDSAVARQACIASLPVVRWERAGGVEYWSSKEPAEYDAARQVLTRRWFAGELGDLAPGEFRDMADSA